MKVCRLLEMMWIAYIIINECEIGRLKILMAHIDINAVVVGNDSVFRIHGFDILEVILYRCKNKIYGNNQRKIYFCNSWDGFLDRQPLSTIRSAFFIVSYKH